MVLTGNYPQAINFKYQVDFVNIKFFNQYLKSFIPKFVCVFILLNAKTLKNANNLLRFEIAILFHLLDNEIGVLNIL